MVGVEGDKGYPEISDKPGFTTYSTEIRILEVYGDYFYKNNDIYLDDIIVDYTTCKKWW